MTLLPALIYKDAKRGEYIDPATGEVVGSDAPQSAIRNPQSAIALVRSRPPGFLTVSEAARAMGVSARAVQLQLAGGQLSGCRQGGRWFVDPACRPELRLTAGLPVIATEAGDVLAGLSKDQRSRALARYELCRAYLVAESARPEGSGRMEFMATWVQAAARTGGTDAPSLGSLYRWLRGLQKDGIRALVDRRGRPPGGEAAWTAEARAYYSGLYLGEVTGQNKLTARRCYDLMVAAGAQAEWEYPSYRAACRYAQVALDPKLKMMGRDPEKYIQRMTAYCRRDWSLVPAMGCWVGDHRQFDVFIPRRILRHLKNGQQRWEWVWARPWITAYIDARTWLPTCWRICFDSPDGQRTMSVFIAGVLEHGQPAVLYIDNGKDFRMGRFAGGRYTPGRKGEAIVAGHVKNLIEALGIEARFALPYNARAKVIEPFFRLVSERFDKSFPTYCGRSPEERPSRLSARKLHRRAEEYATNGLTLEAFAAAFARWVTDDYALRQSPSRACPEMSALRAFHELRDPAIPLKVPTRESMAMALLVPGPAICVRPQGVYVHGFGRHYWHECLSARAGGSGGDASRKVRVRFDPDDPSYVVLSDACTDRLLCVATPSPVDGMHPMAKPGTPEAEALGQAIAFQRREERYTREALAEVRKAAGTQLLVASRAAAGAQGLLDDPATIRRATPAVIRLSDHGDAERAAAQIQGAKTQASRRDQSAAAFFAATGTDDSQAAVEGVRQAPSPLEFLLEAQASREAATTGVQDDRAGNRQQGTGNRE